MAVTINASTSSGLIQTADTSGTMQLQSNGTSIAQVNTSSLTGLQGGLIQPYQYYELNTAYAGSNATGAQSIFGLTNGFTLAGSTIYEFESIVALSKSAGTTSHTIAIGFGGTATINNIGYALLIANDATFTTISTPSLLFIQTASATVATGAITAASRVVYLTIKGIVSVNAAGTFLPQYTLSAAPGGAYTTQIGNYFKISQLAASGANVSIGTVS